MNVHTRRTFLTLSLVGALGARRASASLRPQSRHPLFSCGAAFGTPEISEVETDLVFDEAYIDTTIPYLTSALTLTEEAVDVIEDERVLAIAQRILDEQSHDIEILKQMRLQIFGDEAPAEATHEKMLIAMGGMESCTDQTHMLYMDQEWVLNTWRRAETPYFAWVSMMVLLTEMELHQHSVGVELAVTADLKAFCQRQVEVKITELETLTQVRRELLTRS